MFFSHFCHNYHQEDPVARIGVMGGGGLGNSGNARKKKFFFNWCLPLPLQCSVSSPVYYFIHFFSRKKFKGIVFCLQYSVSSKSFHKYLSRKKWKGITSIPSFAAAINQSFANQQLQGTAILTIDDENPYGWSHYHKQVVIIIFFYWTQVRSLPFQWVSHSFF